MKLFRYLLLFLVFFSFSLFPQSGKVIKVKDGDTFEMLVEGKAVAIRLAHIDCPEKNQDYGSVAKKLLSDLIFGKTVTIITNGNQTYDRLIADVYLEDGSWINLKIVEAGYAWWYEKYSSNKEIKNAEAKARQQKIGLWKDPNPVPPWNYRKGMDKKDNPKKVKSQCKGTTKKGIRCKKNAIEGSDFCSTHKPK